MYTYIHIYMSQDSLGFPRVHYGLLGFARISQGLTRRNKVAQGLTRSHMVLQGLTRSQKVPHFSRCCLSERSRKAMHEGRFPFFSRPLRSLTIQGLLDTLSDALRGPLQERAEPGPKALGPLGQFELEPMSGWLSCWPTVVH